MLLQPFTVPFNAHQCMLMSLEHNRYIHTVINTELQEALLGDAEEIGDVQKQNPVLNKLEGQVNDNTTENGDNATKCMSVCCIPFLYSYDIVPASKLLLL